MSNPIDIVEFPRLTAVRVRMWIIGAVIGFLGQKVFGGQIPVEVAPVVGAVVAEIYDWAAFQLKRWFIREGWDISLGSVLMAAMLVLLALPAASSAQTSVSIVYDPSSKGTYEVVGTRLGTLRNVLGRGIDVPVVGFVGVGARNRPLGGFALAPSFRLADNLAGSVGVGSFVSASKPTGLALYGGLTWTLSPGRSVASTPVSLRALSTDARRR